ncbi:MAG: hypothetical protein K2I14_01545 [Eubacterium sp.]|nr:hypothetical protein [Eubacterium sp.]
MKKRMIIFSAAMIFLFSVVAQRIGYVVFSGNYEVSSAHNSYTVDIDKIYETVYDRNLNRISNKTENLVAVIRPTEKCLTEMNKLFTYKEREEIMEELKQGYPVVREIDHYISCKYIKILETTNRHSDDMLAKNLVAACENIKPDAVGSRAINFSVDAIGRLLDGDEGMIIDENYNTKKGISLTLDNRIQKITEDAGSDMKSGAIVVLDTDTGEVLASYSTPNDYLNRAFSSYCVGSVYKLVVAACALENGMDDTYECKGQIAVGDTTFTCQKDKKHGKQTIKEALANSCNCYFIELALKLGPEKIIDLSKNLGFGETNHLYEEWSVLNGNFPDSDDLQSKGQLALLGFGQGKLTDSPLHFSSVIASIANGGMYRMPKVVFGNVDDEGNVDEIKDNESHRAMSEDTAKVLREYMRYVVVDGSGKSADYNNQTAGKTSTAQSGRMVGEREILYTWFAGFYPFDNPKYSIVVMTEDGTSGAADCGPIFRTIVENIDE